MATPETDRVLSRLGERLLTLRVTVVLSRNLDVRRPAALDEEMTAKRLFDTWSDYLDQLDEAIDVVDRKRGAEDPAPAQGMEQTGRRARAPSMLQDAQKERRAAHPDFGLLAERAKQLHDEIEDPGARGVAVRNAVRAPRQAAARAAPVAAKAPPSTSVLNRIAALGQALDEHSRADQTDPVHRVSRRLLFEKALALDTDPVLLETVIGIDGDVTTRIDETILEQGDDHERHRLQTVLALQRMGIETAVSWWSGLVALVGSAGRALVELVLRR